MIKDTFLNSSNAKQMWSFTMKKYFVTPVIVAIYLKNALRHFRLLFWSRWTEIQLEARSQRPLPSLRFSGRSEKQNGRPGLWFAETFSTSALKPLNGIQRNLTGSIISTSSTEFVVFGPIGKTKLSALVDSSKRWHIVLRCTISGPLCLLFFTSKQKHTRGDKGSKF